MGRITVRAMGRRSGDGWEMSEDDLLKCAHVAFDLAAKELEAERGLPSKSERATIIKRPVPALREGSQMPEVATLPLDRQRLVIARAGQLLVRRLVEKTCGTEVRQWATTWRTKFATKA